MLVRITCRNDFGSKFPVGAHDFLRISKSQARLLAEDASVATAFQRHVSRFDSSGRLFDIFSLICVGVSMGNIPAVSLYIHPLQEYTTFVYSDVYECIGYIQYQAMPNS